MTTENLPLGPFDAITCANCRTIERFGRCDLLDNVKADCAKRGVPVTESMDNVGCSCFVPMSRMPAPKSHELAACRPVDVCVRTRQYERPG